MASVIISVSLSEEEYQRLKALGISPTELFKSALENYEPPESHSQPDNIAEIMKNPDFLELLDTYQRRREGEKLDMNDKGFFSKIANENWLLARTQDIIKFGLSVKRFKEMAAV